MSILNEFYKDSGDVLDYQIDWTSWLNGDTISTSTWTVPTGLYKTTDTKTTLITTIWISGGVSNNEYEVMNEIVTAGGRVKQQTLKFHVREA